MSNLQNSTPPSSIGRPQFSLRDLCTGDSLSNLIHKLCHEIDNPLTAIISIAAVIQRTDLGSDQSFAEKLPTYAEAISKEAWRVSALAEKLLLMSSTRQDTLSPCDANKLLRGTIAKLLDADDFADVAVSITVPEEASIIELSQEHLSALLREILLNSLHEYAQMCKSADGPRPRPIRVALSCTRDQLTLHVSNETSSSRHPNLDRLFEPFVTHPPHTHALGLGLTVAWGVVERAGGKIAVEERELEGRLEFITTVTLPRTTIGKHLAEDTASIRPSDTDNTRDEIALSILIIEDEELVASAMAKILELSFQGRSGAQCTVHGAPEALEALAAGSCFDAVLCDLNLKKTSGRHIFDFICSSRPELKHRFAFLTGDSLSSETSLYLTATGCPYLFKPFESEQIVSLVRTLASAVAVDAER